MSADEESVIENRAREIEHELRETLVRTAEPDLIRTIVGDEDRIRSALFRFVDVFPALNRPGALARHLVEYFPDDAPWIMRLSRRAAASSWLAGMAEMVTRRVVRTLARRFIAGETPLEAVAAARRLESDGCGASIDLLGEAVVSKSEAGRYRDLYLELLDAFAVPWPGAPPAPLAPCGPRKNCSIKLSALTPRFHPLDTEGSSRAIRERLRPILRRARDAGVHVQFDMEEYESRDLTLRVAQDLLDEPEFRERTDVGIVVQSYLRDADAFLDGVLAWIRTRGLGPNGSGMTIRLVRGAYWDVEVALALAAGRTPPVWRTHAETDACYHRLLDRLLDPRSGVRTAVATHNVPSIAQALATVEARRLEPGSWEFQMLHGMGAPLARALTARRLPLRLYVPIGDLTSGIGYLVRRLLENASNESLLGISLRRSAAPAAVVDDWPRTELAHAPLADFARSDARDEFDRAIRLVKGRLGARVPIVLAGRELDSARTLSRRDPSNPDRVVSESALASPDVVDRAAQTAEAARLAWEGRGFAERAAILRKAADLLLEIRGVAAVWEIFEAGKPWREADADVCEAVDHLRFAAQEADRLAAGEILEPQIPGERNILRYRSRGVVAVITPWNFPVAIPSGAIAPALAAGNAVLFKPAEQTPQCGLILARALWDAGVPEDVLAFLPGTGEECGAALAHHPLVAMIAFTGSRGVGLRIAEVAARPGARGLRRVVFEMGGKNAIVVDASADPDEAVRAVRSSAFDYAGQKCSAASRLVVVDGAEGILDRLVGASSALRIGSAVDSATDLPPLIDEAALAKFRRHAEIARRDGAILLETRQDLLPAKGWFAGPMIVDRLPPDSPVLRDEIFGPLLAVRRARDLDDAIAIASDSDYALTAGLFSRTPSHIRRFLDTIEAGNVYINRKITGAVVGRHPFGGMRFSGSGEKAGGPGTIHAYLQAVSVSEKTIRHGFVEL